MRRRVLGALLLFAMAGCESVIGADFGSKTDACDPLSDGTCPKKLKCAWDTSAFHCATTAGKSGFLQACTDESDCPEGAACATTPTLTSSRCLYYCTAQSACGGAKCLGFNQKRTRTTDGTEIGVCAPLDPACNPVSGDAATCQTALGKAGHCWAYGAEYTTCVSQTASGMTGDTCKYQSECAPGYVCMANDLCRKFCHVQGPNECGSGLVCKDFSNDPVTVGGVSIGFCGTP